MNLKVEIWNGHKIRFVEVKPGEWWAVAKDIASALSYSDTNAMTRHLKSKYLTSVKLTGMNQNFTAISEFGIYKAVLRSQRPEAEAFEEWVFEMLKTLRQASGFEGFQVFRMLDKEHQKKAMSRLNTGLEKPAQVDFIKANTIANKTVSTLHGYSKLIKKENMSPKMLTERQKILDDTINLMTASESFSLGISISDAVYGKYLS